MKAARLGGRKRHGWALGRYVRAAWRGRYRHRLSKNGSRCGIENARKNNNGRPVWTRARSEGNARQTVCRRHLYNILFSSGALVRGPYRLCVDAGSPPRHRGGDAGVAALCGKNVSVVRRIGKRQRYIAVWPFRMVSRWLTCIFGGMAGAAARSYRRAFSLALRASSRQAAASKQ